MDSPWAVHGQSMDSPSTVHGQTIDCPWTVHGLSMDPLVPPRLANFAIPWRACSLKSAQFQKLMFWLCPSCFVCNRFHLLLQKLETEVLEEPVEELVGELMVPLLSPVPELCTHRPGPGEQFLNISNY